MKIKFGVIGTGIMGNAVGKVLQLLPNSEVIAAAESVKERRDKFGKDFKISPNLSFVRLPNLLFNYNY